MRQRQAYGFVLRSPGIEWVSPRAGDKAGPQREAVPEWCPRAPLRPLSPNTGWSPHLFHLSNHSFYSYWVSIMGHVPGSPLLSVTPSEVRPAKDPSLYVLSQNVLHFYYYYEMIFSSVTIKRGANTDKSLFFKVNYSPPIVVFSFSWIDFF